MMKKREIEELSLIQKYAQEIASSTASIIGHNIIITDTNGLIVGASRAERIGTLHEASLAVIESGVDSETSEEEATSLRGTLPGLTFPIQSLNGRIAGTMAITGNPQEVRPFGLIVKKQIEILLRERELYSYSANRENILQSLIHDLEIFVPGVSNETLFLSRAMELGYDPSLFYIPIIVDLYQFGRYALAVRQEMQGQNRSSEVEMRILNTKKALLSEMRGIFSHPRDISCISGNSRFVGLHAVRGTAHPTPEDEKAAIAEAEDLSHRLLDKLSEYGLKAAIGIGSLSKDIPALSSSYQEARRALLLGKKFHQGPGVYCIANFRIEDLITSIDARVRTRFIRTMTDNLRVKSDWPELAKTIRCWCESGFSLIGTARLLHIHRSSLIYRLEKISNLTGMDIHDFRTCFGLYFALLLSQYSGPTMQEKAAADGETEKI